MIANTAGQLIDILSKLDPDTVVMTIDPPFDGVKVVPQGDGKALICRPRAPESKSTPATRL